MQAACTPAAPSSTIDVGIPPRNEQAPPGAAPPASEHNSDAAPTDSVNEQEVAVDNSMDGALNDREGDLDVTQVLQSSGMDAPNLVHDVNTSCCTFPVAALYEEDDWESYMMLPLGPCFDRCLLM